MSPALTPDLSIEASRARSVRRLFTRILLHILWWDIVLNRRPLRYFRSPALPRWVELARVYRVEAERLGGVLIKLGQYVSARVDLVPKEVTDVMMGLHDAVPPAPGAAIMAQIEADFLLPLGTLFRAFDPIPIGAASLGQAHRAEMPDGRPVVVKALRPGIDRVIESDLSIVGRFIRRLKRLKKVRDRVDLDLLAEEFITVTRRELDLLAEGRNAERFARQFADDPQIYVPTIEWSRSGPRTLTMEDVSYLPIDDVLGYEAAGVDRHKVAGKLMDCYLDQVFRHGFVHADPHPGNLFIQPLAVGDETTMKVSPGPPGASNPLLPHVPDRPFRLIFIDFGMFVDIPDASRQSLRTYALGIATRDAYTIVQSYVEGDLLMPDANVDQLERMIGTMLNKFPGAFIGHVRHTDLPEYGRMFQQYQSIVYDSPLKLPAELLFVFRAMGTCTGTVTAIDPRFDPAARFAPLAQRIAFDELSPDPDRIKRLIALVARLPARLDTVLTKIERGRLRVQTQDPDERKEGLRLVERMVRQLCFAVLAAGLMVCAVLLGRDGEIVTSRTGLAVLAIAALAALAVLPRRG